MAGAGRRDADRRSGGVIKRAQQRDVVIINETFARRHFPGEDAIGRTLITGMVQRPSQVVGVVADIRGEQLNTPPEPEYFMPVLQRPGGFTNVLVRSHLGPAAVALLVREALRTTDPDLPLLQPDALATRIAQTVANRKLGLVLLGGFAALALVLASLGVYSGKLEVPYDAFAAGIGDHRLVTTLCPGGKERMRRLMELVRGRRVDLLPMLTHRFNLKDIHEAYALFGERREGVVKVAIRP